MLRLRPERSIENEDVGLQDVVLGKEDSQLSESRDSLLDRGLSEL